MEYRGKRKKGIIAMQLESFNGAGHAGSFSAGKMKEAKHFF